jgi:hypothetical protein
MVIREEDMKKIAIFSILTLVLFGCGVEPSELYQKVGINSLCASYLQLAPDNEYHIAAIAELQRRGIEPKECLAMDRQ